MSRSYEVLKKMDILSEENIQTVIKQVKNLVKDKNTPIQGRLGDISRMSHAYFDLVKRSAAKILNNINLYGLGVQGVTAYIAKYRKSNFQYDRIKADIADQYRSTLISIQQLDLYKLLGEVGNIITKLYELQTQLHQLIKLFQPHKGGKIGAIILSKKHLVLMNELAELYVFIREQEYAVKKAKNDIDNRYLDQTPKSKPQAPQYQIVGALDKENKAIEDRHLASGIGLFKLIRQQAYFLETGKDRDTIKSEAKFEAMLARHKAAVSAQSKNGNIKGLQKKRIETNSVPSNGDIGKYYRAPIVNPTKSTDDTKSGLDHKHAKK